MSTKSPVTLDKIEKIPPRERILAVATELFYRNGIRAVGVDAIAEAAGTNKMTLYRHFASKDELVAEYLRQSAKREAAELGAARRRSTPATRSRNCAPGSRICPITSSTATSAAARSPTPRSSCRTRIIRRGASSSNARCATRDRVIALCRAAGLNEPEQLADELNIMLEGARVTAQSVGIDGLAARLERMSEALIAAHSPK